MSRTNSNERIQWVDAMRGFSMILVVFGHVDTNIGFHGYESFLGNLFITFRMPLFFFVSGFFSYRLVNWWNKRHITEIIVRKIQAQIICTFIFSSIYQLTLGSGTISYVNGFGGYWFTIVLFQMYISYLIFSLITKGIRYEITTYCLILVSIISLIIIAFNKSNSIVWNILSWENLTRYYQYFALGVICSRYKKTFFHLLDNVIFKTIMIVGWIICLILWYNITFKLSFPFCYRIIHDIAIRYFSLMTVIIMFHYSSKKIDYSHQGKYIQFIGKRTLDIYMIHFFLLPDLSFLKGFLENGNMFVIQFVIVSFISIVIVIMCLVISCILRQSPYLATWLFGVKYRIETTKA